MSAAATTTTTITSMTDSDSTKVASPTTSPARLSPLPSDQTLLYFCNIPFDHRADELTAWLESHAPIKVHDLTIVTRRGKDGLRRSRGIGFVRIMTSDLSAALTLHGRELGGRTFDIAVAKVQDHATAKADSDSGVVVAAGRRKATSTSSSMVEADGAAVGSSDSSTAHANKVSRGRLQPDETHELVYVNNLPFDYPLSSVAALFRISASDCEVIPSKFGRFSGRSRGFGFIRVPREQVDAALALHGSEVLGRKIGVSISTPRNSAASSLASSTDASATTSPSLSSFN